MVEIRLHGRGGQGAVIGGKILATAVFTEGKYSQAFPAFGVERRGAPVTAFVRINDNPIRLRHQIYHPDHLIILDPTLMKNIEVFEGLKPGGFVVVNTKHDPGEFRQHPMLKENKIAVINANEIAIRHGLGSPTSPIVNTAILGAFCRVTELCSIETICTAILKGVPIKPEANAAAARDAYEGVRLA
jgi:2-oxoacid:acceptor oxidoreductase gamma subunit (pyruvate/2-ketoisovalerate family)